MAIVWIKKSCIWQMRADIKSATHAEARRMRLSDDLVLALLVFFVLFGTKLVSAEDELLVYRRSICTGLGDRLGMLLSLSAAAQAYGNMSIVFRWCGEEAKSQLALDNPLHFHFIPGWTGFYYTLEELHSLFPQLPPHVRLVEEWPSSPALRTLSDEGDKARFPPVQGLPFLPAAGHRIFAAEGRPPLTEAAFREAYTAVAALLQPAPGYMRARFDVLVHMRGMDHNTAFADMAPQSFCTVAVLTALAEDPRTAALKVAVMSHKRRWAKQTLGPRFRQLVLRQMGALQDMALLLSVRRGIVQHASGGWSAFSNVPALARPHIALLNTYRGLDEHRFSYFQRHYNISLSNAFRCHETAGFVDHVAALPSSSS
jgi:hypothetical protein